MLFQSSFLWTVIIYVLKKYILLILQKKLFKRSVTLICKICVVLVIRCQWNLFESDNLWLYVLQCSDNQINHCVQSNYVDIIVFWWLTLTKKLRDHLFERTLSSILCNHWCLKVTVDSEFCNFVSQIFVWMMHNWLWFSIVFSRT